MLNNLANLYQELILDHSRNPRNLGELPSPPAFQRVGSNPLCGDKLIAYLELKDKKIINICYKGEGCTIFMSTCSMMSEFLKGKTTEEATIALNHFMILITLTEDNITLSKENLDSLGKLGVFDNIRNYPARVKCAALFARTIQSLIENPEGEITITSDTH